MNRLVVGILAFIATAPFLYAQRVFDASNARMGEEVEYCHQHVRLNEIQNSDPVMYQSLMNDRDVLNQEARNYTETKSGTVYVIPIVFHVLHNDGAENISDEQIFDAVAILNRDFRRLNADANLVAAPFQGMPTDAEIEFRLATKAPNGDCFKGITRTKSPLTVEGTGGGNGQLQAAFNGNDVYNGTWSHEKYLNILVAKQIGGAAGYTMYPNDWSTTSNSIFILSEYVGSIGTGMEGRSRALTHEVGHWLNLSHTWGDNNNPGNASSCSQDDHVMDTPLCIGVTSCNLSSNTCNDASSSLSSWTTNVVDNVENYMDYSYCSKMFTQGQVSRMRAAITSPTGGRNKLWTAANIIATGAIDNPPLCAADFSSPKRVICIGETVQFNDETYNSVSGWSWSFPGGSPATSTDENPTVTYSTPGTYNVTLVASDAGSTRTETKNAYITVLDNPSSLPFYEGFESYSNLTSTGGKWFVDGDYQITTTAANSGSKSVRVNNFPTTEQKTHTLTSAAVDLSNETLNNVTLSFRYAYRRKATNTQEYLKVYFSGDCAADWGAAKKVMTASVLSSQVQTTPYTPAQADWKTVHILFNNSTYNQYLVENFRYKFDFEANNGNNFYLDDINIYRGVNSDELVLGINDFDNEVLKDAILFPNPNDGEVNLSFSIENGQNVFVDVMDLSGNILKSTSLNANAGENILMMDNSDFAAGVYFVQLKTETSNKTLQFIKK